MMFTLFFVDEEKKPTDGSFTLLPGQLEEERQVKRRALLYELFRLEGKSKPLV